MKKQKPRVTPPITPAQFIRQHLLRMQASELAAEIGVSTSIVSRYEVFPERHRKTIVKLGKQRKVVIKPGWFEMVPFKLDVPL